MDKFEEMKGMDREAFAQDILRIACMLHVHMLMLSCLLHHNDETEEEKKESFKTMEREQICFIKELLSSDADKKTQAPDLNNVNMFFNR